MTAFSPDFDQDQRVSPEDDYLKGALVLLDAGEVAEPEWWAKEPDEEPEWSRCQRRTGFGPAHRVIDR